VTPPSTLHPELPAELDGIVLRAMSRNPADRYPSVHALGAALLTFASPRTWAVWGAEFCGFDAPLGGTRADDSSAAPRATTDSGGAVVVSRSPSRHRLGAVALLAVAAGGVVGAISFLTATPQPPAGAESSSRSAAAIPELKAELGSATRMTPAIPAIASERTTKPAPAVSAEPAFPAPRAPRNARTSPPGKASPERTPKPAQAATPSVERGTHGALILE
jgi:serine/threonine-protein kinase